MGRHGMRFSALLALGSLLACLLSAPRARASDDVEVAAAAAFEEGQKAFVSADYARAARAFELAYAKKPHHDALWNAARSRHRAGELAAAANLYARYLTEAPATAPDRDKATAALLELRASVARLEVHAAPGVADVHVDGTVLVGSELYVDPGEHLVQASSTNAAGAVAPVRKTALAQKGESVHVTLDGAPEEQPVVVVPPVQDRPRPFALPWPVAAGGAVLTVAAASFTIWSGLDTKEQRDRFDASRTQSDLDEGRERQTRTNVLLGVTLGLAALTAVAALLGRF